MVCGGLVCNDVIIGFFFVVVVVVVVFCFFFWGGGGEICHSGVPMDNWQMKFNVAKCHVMRVTRHPPDKHIQFDYTLHQQRFEQVQSAKYL